MSVLLAYWQAAKGNAVNSERIPDDAPHCWRSRHPRTLPYSQPFSRYQRTVSRIPPSSETDGA